MRLNVALQREMTGPWKHPLGLALESDDRPVARSFQARSSWGPGTEARWMQLGYWSGMRRVKNSTSSEAAGGSRLLRPTTT
jgi:hypothetical protein